MEVCSQPYNPPAFILEKELHISFALEAEWAWGPALTSVGVRWYGVSFELSSYGIWRQRNKTVCEWAQMRWKKNYYENAESTGKTLSLNV